MAAIEDQPVEEYQTELVKHIYKYYSAQEPNYAATIFLVQKSKILAGREHIVREVEYLSIGAGMTSSHGGWSLVEGDFGDQLLADFNCKEGTTRNL